MERLREEKDQEILVLDESMTQTIRQLQEAQQVIIFHSSFTFSPDKLSKNMRDLDGANDTQIDTLILDNQKKLNQIIGVYF